jgi:site-specific DNA-methyltransferase (adenine-specific)|tara:strand:- start:36 stop:908 length:873 start_codon:yes stop_codon:yes gene_type:complete
MIVNADCIEHLKTIEDNYFDSVVTDPPYHLTSIAKRFTNSTEAKYGKDGSFQRLSKGFHGHEWDGGDIAFTTDLWKEVYRTIKPGSVLLAFAATRNYHKMATAIENSGFEIMDMINWIYGSGFPKRKNLLKPAHEPIVMARKGVNKDLNLDECRVNSDNPKKWTKPKGGYWKTDKDAKAELVENTKGRWPANIIHDGLDEQWARYFYSAKASNKEKDGSKHPTVKPISLMRYLVKLVTPKEGLVLDPFAGTGTTGEACILENRKYYLIEKTKEYIPDIENRLNKYGRLGI